MRASATRAKVVRNISQKFLQRVRAKFSRSFQRGQIPQNPKHFLSSYRHEFASGDPSLKNLLPWSFFLVFSLCFLWTSVYCIRRRLLHRPPLVCSISHARKYKPLLQLHRLLLREAERPVLALRVRAVLARKCHIHSRQNGAPCTVGIGKVVVPHVRVVANSIP